jgi:molybdopterin molybdotransferase
VTAGNDEFNVIGAVPAGSYFKGSLLPGQAIRIMTGAPVPEGADAVVPIEDVEILTDRSIRLGNSPEPGQHIRPQGEEVQPGERVLSKGRLLKPADLGLLASLGFFEVPVIPKPRISVITTGNEVVEPCVKPRPGQIRNSNQPAIVASVMDAGYPMVFARHVPDDPGKLESTLLNCPGDVILTSGGVSVGDHDDVKKVLAKIGEIYFWKVAIKPGKPFVFGKIKSSSPAASGGGSMDPRPTTAGDDVSGPWVFGLPGNPVSSLVAFEVLVKPALKALSGQSGSVPELPEATLLKPIHHKPGRREFVRAQAHANGKGLVVEPLPWQGSGMLRSLTEANAWVVVPEDSEEVAAGSRVEVVLR